MNQDQRMNESVGINVDQYRQIHQSKDEYGAGSRHFDYVRLLITCFGFKDVLDYGCGKGVLADQLSELPGVVCTKFDPAIPGIDHLPSRKFDAVVNTDVLEHVPEPELDAVLSNFTALSPSAIIVPHLALAREILANGENAHCTILSPDEWQSVFERHYGYVSRLPHDSPKHALFLCSQDEIETELAYLAAQYIVQGVTAPNEVRQSLDSSFMDRTKSAIKLILGKKGARVLSRARRVFQSR